MKRASYRSGIAWIAQNDEPEELDAYLVAHQISVVLLADLFDVDLEKVGRDVIKYRKKMK